MIQSKAYIVAKDFLDRKLYSGVTYEEGYNRVKFQLERLVEACGQVEEHSAASFEAKYIARLEKLNDKLMERINDTSI